MHKSRITTPLAFCLLVATSSLFAQDLASFEKRTTLKKLDNGLTLIIMERPEAPVFSYAASSVCCRSILAFRPPTSFPEWFRFPTLATERTGGSGRLTSSSCVASKLCPESNRRVQALIFR